MFAGRLVAQVDTSRWSTFYHGYHVHSDWTPSILGTAFWVCPMWSSDQYCQSILVPFGLSKWVECPATSRAKPMAKPPGPCSKRLPEWSAALQASLERTPWGWCLHWSIAVQSPIWLPCTLGRQLEDSCGCRIQFQLSGAHSDAIVSPSPLSSYIVSCGILGPQKSYGQSPGNIPLTIVDTTPPTHTDKHLLHIQPQI